jgi:hypothetical protein
MVMAGINPEKNLVEVIELKNHPFFYKLGRFVGEDLICPVCFDAYFKGSLGKDRPRKYDSETLKKIEG